mmetsp:Transcript_60120/g.140063  ORF Transcript_60120/g.140063 Transcript_60120/m.140063 type:complete len:234 (-) Transcript_60120:212-913(-)
MLLVVFLSVFVAVVGGAIAAIATFVTLTSTPFVAIPDELLSCCQVCCIAVVLGGNAGFLCRILFSLLVLLILALPLMPFPAPLARPAPSWPTIMDRHLLRPCGAHAHMRCPCLCFQSLLHCLQQPGIFPGGKCSPCFSGLLHTPFQTTTQLFQAPRCAGRSWNPGVVGDYAEKGFFNSHLPRFIFFGGAPKGSSVEETAEHRWCRCSRALQRGNVQLLLPRKPSCRSPCDESV